MKGKCDDHANGNIVVTWPDGDNVRCPLCATYDELGLILTERDTVKAELAQAQERIAELQSHLDHGLDPNSMVEEGCRQVADERVAAEREKCRVVAIEMLMEHAHISHPDTIQGARERFEDEWRRRLGR